MNSKLIALVRELRDELWKHTEYKAAHEREWETEEQEHRRKARNAYSRQKWAAETERLIRDATS